MTSLTELASPSLLVDVNRLQHNIEAMAQTMAAPGVSLRPHAKTSKCLPVLQRQLAAGAAGFTCSTPAEVTMLAAAGISNLLWAHLPVGPVKVAFAVAAAREHGLVVALDSLDAAAPLAAAAAREGVQVPFFLEVNTGQGRAGVEPDRALQTAEQLGDLTGLTLRGVMTHEGHLATYGPDRHGLDAAGTRAGQLLSQVAAELRADGYACDTVSVGSTPGAASAPFAAGVTEARPGTYVYFDANQVRLGSATLADCALTVLARVVSTQRRGTAIIDAGVKAMSSDALTPENGAGIVCDLDSVPIEGLSFPVANEEHGFLVGPAVADLRVGDLLRIIPNHACGTTNMWSGLHVVDRESVVERWAIGARH